MTAIIILLIVCTSVILADNRGKTFNKPSWFNLYMDNGYVYGNYSKIESKIKYERYLTLFINGQAERYLVPEDLYDNLEIKERSNIDVSFGALIFPNIEYIPLYFNFGISNIYNGSKRDSFNYSQMYYEFRYGNWFRNNYISDYNKDESNPIYLFGTGYYKVFHNYLINISLSYLSNIKGMDIYRNYSLSTSVTKNFSNFFISLGGEYLINNSCLSYRRSYSSSYISRIFTIRNNAVCAELNISYRYKFINPYITFYSELYNNPRIKHDSSKNINWQIEQSDYLKDYRYMIIKTGIIVSCSNIAYYLRNTYKGFTAKNVINSNFKLGF